MLWVLFRNWMTIEEARQLKEAQVAVDLGVIRGLVENGPFTRLSNKCYDMLQEVQYPVSFKLLCSSQKRCRRRKRNLVNPMTKVCLLKSALTCAKSKKQTIEIYPENGKRKKAFRNGSSEQLRRISGGRQSQKEFCWCIEANKSKQSSGGFSG